MRLLIRVRVRVGSRLRLFLGVVVGVGVVVLLVGVERLVGLGFLLVFLGMGVEMV